MRVETKITVKLPAHLPTQLLDKFREQLCRFWMAKLDGLITVIITRIQSLIIQGQGGFYNFS